MSKAVEFGRDGNLQKVLYNELSAKLDSKKCEKNYYQRIKDYQTDFELSAIEFDEFTEYEKFEHQNGLVLNSYSAFTKAYVSKLIQFL